MSIIRCKIHDRNWDSDKIDGCPLCENVEVLLEAPINHEREPHCCGCWVLYRDDKTVFAKCNECGEYRDIIDLLAKTASYEQGMESLVTVIARVVNLGGQGMNILDAPCVFCGYNGRDYWQVGTHDKDCIFHDFGGDANRADHVSNYAAAIRARVGK